jgi:hypothetical protein
MMSEAQAQPRWSFSIFMIVLATSIPFVVTGVDPLLLSLNPPAIRQDLGIPSDLVRLTGSAATLVMAAAVLGVGNLGDLYGHKRLLIYGDEGSLTLLDHKGCVPGSDTRCVHRIIEQSIVHLPQADKGSRPTSVHLSCAPIEDTFAQ